MASEAPTRSVRSRDTVCSVAIDGNGEAVAIGTLLKMMDQCACMAAETFSLHPCVTAGIDEVSCGSGVASDRVPAGAFLVVEATVNAGWRSSCEVGCIASLEVPGQGARKRLVSAYFTFVSLQKVAFPALTVDAGDVDQSRRLTEAQERRRIRLARKSMLVAFVDGLRRSRANTASGPSGDALAGSAELLQLVLPGHCNHHGNLFGGWTLEWAVQAALLAGSRHAGAVVTLVQSDDIMFVRPICVGDRVLLKARVNRVFPELGNKMEVGVRLLRRSLGGGEELALTAYFMVEPAAGAVAAPVPQVPHSGADEGRRYAKANARMNLRLERQSLKTVNVSNFCPVVDSSNAMQVSELTAANVSGLLRAFKTNEFSSSCWETVVAGDGVTVKLNHGGGFSRVVYVSFECEMAMSAAAALTYCRDPDKRAQWDVSFLELRVVETLSPSDDVCVLKTRRGMDFVLLRSWRENVQGVEGRLLLSSMSVVHPAVPKAARSGALGGSSGFLLDPRGDSRCHVQYFLAMTTAGLEVLLEDLRGKGALFQGAVRLAQLKET